MLRSACLTVVSALFVLLTTPAFAQEKSAEQFEKRIELLTKESELLQKENALLKKEIEQLRAGEKNKSSSKVKLSDLFVVGAKFSIRTEQIVGPTKGTTGIGVLTITSRDGDSFSATNTWKNDKDGTAGTGEIKGTITGSNKARWKRVDAPNGNEVQATLRPEGDYIDTIAKNAKGLVIRGVIDVSK